MNKVLIIFAHPHLEKSNVNKTMLKEIQTCDGLTINMLYENYPNFIIDVEREKKLLLEHNFIVFHHPIHWYSCPGIMKEWIDRVLEIGFAYGPNGERLQGKNFMQAISTGAPNEAYGPNGYNSFYFKDFLKPFQQKANLCKMIYRKPFLIHGTRSLNPDQIQAHATKYKNFLINYIENGDTCFDQNYSTLEDIKI